MKKNFLPLFGIAFVVALISTGVFYGLIAGRLRSSSEQFRYPVVVAARALERGTLVREADVKMSVITVSEAPPGVYTNVGQTVGFTTVEAMAPGQPLAESKLASHKAIPNGMRVISVHATDSSGVVAMLQPGSRVDVQVIGNQTGGLGLKTLLPGIEVLTVGAMEGSRPVVNLLVHPAEADLLGLADTTARIRLTLRNPLEAVRK